MIRPRSIPFLVSEALKGFGRTKGMSLSAIMVVTISMTILGFFIYVDQAIGNLASLAEKQIEVVVYLEDGHPEKTIREIADRISKWDAVDKVEYISKEKAISLLKDDLGDEGKLFEFVDSNPLPASLEIKVRDASMIDKVVDDVKKEAGVWIEEVSYGRELSEKLFTLTNMVRKAGTLLVLLSLLASIVIVISTIKLTVYAREDEIEIMRLVGATDWFIRLPFLLEGILVGLAGSLLAVGILVFTSGLFATELAAVVPFAGQIIKAHGVFEMAWKLSVIGTIIGALGSLVAVRKLLRLTN
jgi:cell division transport system permease protein